MTLTLALIFMSLSNAYLIARLLSRYIEIACPTSNGSITYLFELIP